MSRHCWQLLLWPLGTKLMKILSMATTGRLCKLLEHSLSPRSPREKKSQDITSTTSPTETGALIVCHADALMLRTPVNPLLSELYLSLSVTIALSARRTSHLSLFLSGSYTRAGRYSHLCVMPRALMTL